MKVLFVRTSSLGDIVLTTGVIRYFHRQFPEAEIHVLTSLSGEEIFGRLNFVTKTHVLAKNVSFIQILKKMADFKDFDYVFDLQGNVKSKILKIVNPGLKFFSIKKDSLARRLFVKFRFKGHLLNKHITQKYAEVFLRPFKMSMPTLEDIKPNLPSAETKTPKRIVISPFASQKNKEWPYFFDLAKKILELSYEVIVVGNGNLPWPKGVIDKTNRTSIGELIDVIDGAEIVICADSGPLHISYALGKPVICLFGPTTQELGFMPPYKGVTVIENKGLSCRPCHVHGGNHCPLKHFKCMRDIPLDLLIEKLKELENHHRN